MNTLLLNIVWPAIEVAESLNTFWYLVFGTIIIELFTIKYFLKYSWEKSLAAAAIGNCVSGSAGTYLMMWGMLAWHFTGGIFSEGTFSLFNWIATYILMCLGSVLLEALAIKLLFKEKIRRVYLPMLIGNVLSYVFIGFYIADKNHSDVVRQEEVSYMPDKVRLKLQDSSYVDILPATISLEYDKDGKLLNEIYKRYPFTVYFEREKTDRFLCGFELLEGGESTNGMNSDNKELYCDSMLDTYHVLVDGPNPNTSIGWQQPVMMDTITFTRIK